MKPFNVTDNLRSVQFLGDAPEGALSNAVRWLEDKDASGRANAFYFLDLSIEKESEIGWVVSVYCGQPNPSLHLTASRKKRGGKTKPRTARGK